MAASLVILTGASGSGKTTLAKAVDAARLPGCEVVYFDSIGVPAAEEMAALGAEAWQRATTIQWIGRIAGLLRAGTSVLFEGQMRVAFLREALSLSAIEHAQIVLVDCDDATRTRRLRDDRNQPELANADMLNWSRYLRREAEETGCFVMDTGILSFKVCREHILACLGERQPMHLQETSS